MNLFNTLQRPGSRLLAIIVAGALLLPPLFSTTAQERPRHDDGGGSPAITGSDAVSQHVWRLLSAHHALPSKEALLQHAEAPFIQESLRAIAINQELFLLQRRRALLTLATFWPESKATTTLLQEVLEDSNAQPDLYHEAIHALLTHGGEEGKLQVERYLTGEDTVRCQVAHDALVKRALIDTTTTACRTAP